MRRSLVYFLIFALATPGFGSTNTNHSSNLRGRALEPQPIEVDKWADFAMPYPTHQGLNMLAFAFAFFSAGLTFPASKAGKYQNAAFYGAWGSGILAGGLGITAMIASLINFNNLYRYDNQNPLISTGESDLLKFFVDSALTEVIGLVIIAIGGLCFTATLKNDDLIVPFMFTFFGGVALVLKRVFDFGNAIDWLVHGYSTN